MSIEDKTTMLIFGGTGSLGYELVEFYNSNYNITVVSRDEWKQWQMRQTYPSINYILGDVRDFERVEEIIGLVRPSIILNCAALKHIDQCEYNVREAYLTNYQGMSNIVRAVIKSPSQQTKVLFVSTDKACQPVNTYGATKFLAEKVMMEAAKKYGGPDLVFLCVRYGNVLDSRGSIIPVLRTIGKSDEVKSFKLTHPDMTRFVMTQKQAVNLIDTALSIGGNGRIYVPRLKSMRIKDLIELFSELYNKPIEIVGCRPGEKIHEALLSADERNRWSPDSYGVYAPWNKLDFPFDPNNQGEYDSTDDIMSKEELNDYLSDLNLY